MATLLSQSKAPRVALVENDEMLADVIRYNLEAIGALVTSFQDGISALDELLGSPPDLVILNWGLPRLSGIEVLRQMRASSQTCHVPVIMLTSRTEAQDKRRAMSVGAQAFVGKPFSIAELMQKVSGLLDQSASSTHATTAAAGAH